MLQNPDDLNVELHAHESFDGSLSMAGGDSRSTTPEDRQVSTTTRAPRRRWQNRQDRPAAEVQVHDEMLVSESTLNEVGTMTCGYDGQSSAEVLVRNGMLRSESTLNVVDT